MLPRHSSEQSSIKLPLYIKPDETIVIVAWPMRNVNDLSTSILNTQQLYQLFV